MFTSVNAYDLSVEDYLLAHVDISDFYDLTEEAIEGLAGESAPDADDFPDRVAEAMAALKFESKAKAAYRIMQVKALMEARGDYANAS